jgi:FKBP-type peptidyl-prolyl cis-trans isomerase SlyD
MKIQSNSVVTLRYKVMDAQGHPLDDSEEAVTYLQGGEDGLLPTIEAALEGQEIGFKQTFHLEPEHAFGEYDSELLRVENRELFPEPLEVGMQFEGVPGDDEEALGDDEEPQLFIVTELAEDKVVLDGNHPFAGMALRIEIEVLAVRSATEEEIDQGFAEGNEDDEDDDAPLISLAGPKLLH